MQMYDIVATGVLGLLVGFWSGRSIRWKMEETEETGEDREERKNTAARQLVREGVTIGSPVNGEIRKRMEETAEETADAGTGCISIVPEDGKVYAPTAGKVLKLYPMGNRIRFRTDSGLELLLNICRDREELHERRAVVEPRFTQNPPEGGMGNTFQDGLTQLFFRPDGLCRCRVGMTVRIDTTVPSGYLRQGLAHDLST